MVPLVYNSIGMARHTWTAAAACAAAVLTSFGWMDANPSLFYYHQWLHASSLRHKIYQNHFQGKTVWIVGASSGIGEQLAYQVSPYCQRLVLSSRNPTRLQQVAKQCQQFRNTASQRQPSVSSGEGGGDEVVVLPLDVTLPAKELEQVVLQKLVPMLQQPSSSSKLPPEFSQDAASSGTTTTSGSTSNSGSLLDCVILNAGQGHLSPVMETDAATTLRMFQVNALAPIYLTQILLQHGVLYRPPPPPRNDNNSNKMSRRPQIVMTSSVGGRMGVPLSATYAASKHALHGFVSSLQAETSSWLRIDMLCPGPVETNFFQNQQQQQQDSSLQDNDKNDDTKNSPLKMPVERCAALAMSHMVRPQDGGEAWIAQQPTLLGMYLQQYVPGPWNAALTKSIGPKRLSLYEQGLDLYDPASWTKKTGATGTKGQGKK